MPKSSKRKTTIWTPARRKAFAQKMQRARAAAMRGAKKYGSKAVRAVGSGTWAAIKAGAKAGAKEAGKQLRNPRHSSKRHPTKSAHRHHSSKRNPVSGAVIRVTDRGKVFFFPKAPINWRAVKLSNSLADAKRFPAAADAIPLAMRLAKLVPSGMTVHVVG